jgi:hypothetical protein
MRFVIMVTVREGGGEGGGAVVKLGRGHVEVRSFFFPWRARPSTYFNFFLCFICACIDRLRTKQRSSGDSNRPSSEDYAVVDFLGCVSSVLLLNK